MLSVFQRHDPDSLGRLIRPHIPLLRNSYVQTCPDTPARVVPWEKGTALAIRRTQFDAVSGFDEFCFMYFEDADLRRRVNAARWQVRFISVTTLENVGGSGARQRRTEMPIRLPASLQGSPAKMRR